MSFVFVLDSLSFKINKLHLRLLVMNLGNPLCENPQSFVRPAQEFRGLTYQKCLDSPPCIGYSDYLPRIGCPAFPPDDLM